MRIGTGYDSHRFLEGRELVLGGVHIPDHAGLSGHSDGDAVCHAIIDAILGAAAAGNVGSHFPPSDDEWKDADSMDLLARAMRVLDARDYRVGNIDVTVICETPKIGPHIDAMRMSLAKVLHVPSTAISIKGKTNEKMGWIGAGEGLAVHAVALIKPQSGAAGGEAGSGGGAWPL
ncbi:MAG: 2-C-methyl-D-erythritol 2,4-cyclodiphosphate synthase [Gemmatimonadales bacterium]|jgi:2-C-methyl-D-erythritol 2,4-cyclodiphosphate synthase|nr:2-C-methyl-D-erythritol 2,4-cyclodiphosphate synthase [Gemmatimonadales bacterium]MDG2238683.1 2-C-methyl-D-erythritol 2,4-cyclodiphosphate synthase [Longimicrobiales bacterium]NCG33505.1 2-C-methyl-D-erythritol 2,4-cyclodiphosphate synthase [Pseudomonadota bacterium]MBT3498416.1 2-C-methyl-D-erythritol 2,4-cyclodiphosphate synthase [Gemmatimonadales bacterium]MBT3773971.1 2-C-methyl-D-erythritol 2,4-cyclodiphosphate synthase [Gemmatimonadales bacterium]